MKKRINIAIFASGRGSNLRAIIESQIDRALAEDKPVFYYDIVCAVCNHAHAPASEIATNWGFPTLIYPSTDCPETDFRQEKFFDNFLRESEVDLICLAGYDRVLSGDFVKKWENRIINIHPSLLPKHKGLNPHEAVLKSGDRDSGCTVHYVTEKIDSGEIISQSRTPILKGDTPETLAERILKQEHIIYPRAIERLAKDMLEA